MATSTITLRVKVAWWLRPYIHMLAGFCAITGCEPDLDKLNRIIGRAITVK